MNAVVRANADRNAGWPSTLEGVLLTLFGLAAIIWPGKTLAVFTVVFGLWALVAGVVGVINGIMHIRRGWTAVGTILLGGLMIAAGSYVLNHPGITALTLVLLIGFTLLIRGIFEIIIAIGDNEVHKGLAIVSGALAILVGLILLRYPVGGGLAYVWVLGIYALVSGPILIAVGLGAGNADRVDVAE
jgi:uncharacterized membrane protein HdeD (DUF308 family)